jgi:hypothetical protein
MKLGGLGIGFVLACAVVGAMSGCGGAGKGKMLPDGFLTDGCMTASDCAPTVCQVAACNLATHTCQYSDKVCQTDVGSCATATCDPSSGACIAKPADEGMSCTTGEGLPGTCTSGTCNAVPTCYDPEGFGSTISCGAADESVEQASNDPDGFDGATAVVSAYACAPNEAGPELAFELEFDPTMDQDITISLKALNADGTDAVQTSVDLDLIVLSDACTGTATCMNPMTGSTYQGITAGTSAESVTFHASGSGTYYVVVDSKDATQISNFQLEVKACGVCQPTAATVLSCNMTMPISASTATGAANIGTYTCGGTTTVTAPGKELPFYFRSPSDPSSPVYNITATLTGATAAYKMMALPTNEDGACDPTTCIGEVEGASGSNTLTWPLTYDDEGFDTFARNWLVIDTPVAGTDTSFGVEISCAPYCDVGYTFDCDDDESTTFDTTTIGGPTLVTQWGPGAGCDGLTGLTGPETTLMFVPDIIGDTVYTLQLESNTTGVNLSTTILDAGLNATGACNPTAACMANTVLPLGGGFNGTHTTSGDATNGSAGFTFTAQKGHTYYIVVDGTTAAGADFTAKLVGGGCT